LDRQQIIQTALDLLQKGGAKSISTRRLSEQLGIKSSSLYYHFESKQQLLDYLTAAMLAPVWRSPHGGESWQQWLTQIAQDLRRQLHAFKDSTLVVPGTTPPQDFAGESVALLYKPLLQAGFPPDQARYVLFTVLRFVAGWTWDEQVASSRGADRPAAINNEGFEFGIRVIVRGLDAELQSISGGEAADGGPPRLEGSEDGVPAA
jgi:AcrR family transcriptional regulator